MDRLVFGAPNPFDVALFSTQTAQADRPSSHPPPPEVTPADYAAEHEMKNILARVKVEKKMRRRARRRSDAPSSLAPPIATSAASGASVEGSQNSTITPSRPHDADAATGAIHIHTTHTFDAPSSAKFVAAERRNGGDADATVVVAPGDLSSVMSCESSRHDSQYDASRVPETTDEDVDGLARAAHRDGTPCVCLIGSPNLDPDMLSEWSRFCKHAVQTTVVQRAPPSRFCADRLCILVANRNGRFVVYDEEWTVWILRNKMSRAIYALALLDDTNSITTLDDLPEGHSALVYDPICADSQDAMMSWPWVSGGGGYVIALANTPMEAPCVVRRRNEIFETYKL